LTGKSPLSSSNFSLQDYIPFFSPASSIMGAPPGGISTFFPELARQRSFSFPYPKAVFSIKRATALPHQFVWGVPPGMVLLGTTPLIVLRPFFKAPASPLSPQLSPPSISARIRHALFFFTLLLMRPPPFARERLSIGDNYIRQFRSVLSLFLFRALLCV